MDVGLWRKARRQELIARRVGLSDTERAVASEQISARLDAVLTDAAGRLVGLYWPFKGEYDSRGLARALHGKGVALALPVVVGKAQPLVFRPWWPGAPMAAGVWNIPVPAGDEAVEPDILIVPLVGFDGERYRLGYGGGFYDRTLAAMTSRPRTIGVGFSCGRLPTVYPQPYDIRMDVVVTDDGG
jgi:5-formyltetrahydrofolate cyclo-ligase